MIYVYALTDPLDAPPADRPGLGGAPLESVAEEGIGAVFSTSARSPAPDAENLWRHEAVAESLMRGGAVLPARFGTTLSGPARLRALLARNHPAIKAGLEHVRGCVEVGVRMHWEGTGHQARAQEVGEPGDPEEVGAIRDGGPGRAYLLRRLGEERRERAVGQRLEEAAEAVHAPLARLARDAVRRPVRGPGLLTAAYLLERDRVDEFVGRVRDFDRERADRHVLCTGPWPPYSFVPALELEGLVSG